MKKSTVINVGLELEMLKSSSATNLIYEQRGFGRRTDSSIRDAHGNPLSGMNAGIELVTPVLEVDTELSPNGDADKFDFSKVQPVVKDLTRCAEAVNSSCGVHVHLGRPNGEMNEWNPRRQRGGPNCPMSEWKPSHIRTMLLIGLQIENIVFSVVPESRKVSKHCRRIREVYNSSALQAYYPLGDLYPRKQANRQRYCWLNLIETRRPNDPTEERIGYGRSKNFGTFEIRALGETNRFDYIMAWVELWVKVAGAVAYLPSESASLRCAFSGWLQPDIDRLKAFKERHEREDATVNRSVLPEHDPVVSSEE